MPRGDGYQDSLNFTTSMCLIFIIVMIALRLWIRKKNYGIDDIVITSATATGLGFSGTSYACLHYGMGKPWKSVEFSTELSELNDASRAGVVLFLLALYLSKCTLFCLLGRITRTNAQSRIYYACSALIALVGVASIVLATLSCDLDVEFYWAFFANRSSCPAQKSSWEAITGLDIFTEILVLLLPFHMIRNLQMARLTKVKLMLAFWLRLPVLALSLGRNYYTAKLDSAQVDVGLDSALVNIFMEVELAYALAASTLSALRTFTEDFNSGFGLGFTRGRSDDSYNLSAISDESQQRTLRNKSSVADSQMSCKPLLVRLPTRILPVRNADGSIKPGRGILVSVTKIGAREPTPDGNPFSSGSTHDTITPAYGKVDRGSGGSDA